MSNKRAFFRLIGIIPLLISVPGRFAYGILTFLLFLWVMLFGSLLKIVIQKLALKDFEQITMAAALAALVILFRQFLTLFSPVMSLTMSFSVYIIGFSTVVIGGLFLSSKEGAGLGDEEAVSLPRLLHRNIKTVVTLIAPILGFYALRDILGFGTLTLPGRHQLLEWRILKPAGASGFSFWGTSGGAFILLGMILGVYLFCTRKLRIAERS